MTVSLKDFISQTLRDVLGAVKDVQKDTDIGKHIAPWGVGALEYPTDTGVVRKGPYTATVVKFDVAVSAELADSAKATGGLKIAVFSLGVNGEITNKNIATNRIQFAVPVNLPSGDGDPALFVSRKTDEGWAATMPDDAFAEQRSPDLGWGDLKLPPDVLLRLRKFSERLCGHEPGGGLSALFLGPDEAGAKRAAEMIAIAAGLEIRQIGLSSIVSKYIGETEKNIGRIFAAAGAAGALLFFDEADALFGKRADIKDAHARYAEADFFLRRIRDHAGATIVAMRGPPADDALFRRFSVVAPFDFCA